jgi:hypothetical protein
VIHLLRSTLMRSFLPLLVIAVLFSTVEVRAQDQQERPPLPDIAPRTVEIRGALEIFFPGLERQPLIGFNPPPRIVDVSERRPFVEDYRQAAADLPPSPLRAPSGPSLAGLEGIERRTGIVEARVGRYLARHSSARIEHAFSPRLAVTADIHYDGSDGHTPFEFDTEARSSYDNLRGKVALHQYGDRGRLGASIDGFRSGYNLYGATGSVVIPPLLDMPGRDVADLRGSVLYRATPGGTFTFDGRASLRGSLLETSVCPDDNEVCEANLDAYARDQNAIEFSGEFLAHGVTLRPRFAAQMALSGWDTPAIVGTDMVSSQIDIGARVIDTPGLRLSAAARLMHFSTGTEADRPETSALYLSPDVRLDVYPGGGLQIYAENSPSIRHPYLADVLQENPYITHRPEMHPAITLIDARAGARLYRGPATIDFSAGYIDAPSFRFYEYMAGTGGFSEGLFEVRHEHVRQIHAGGDVALLIGGSATAGLSLRWRQLSFADDDEATVPNIGPLTGRASLSVPFAGGRVLTEAGLRYESARYRDRIESRRVGDFFDLDARASFRLNHMMAAVVSIENISGGYLERWNRYPQAPYVVTGGLQITW